MTAHIKAMDGTCGADAYALHCEHCGAIQRTSLPVKVSMYLEGSTAFLEKHKGCLPRPPLPCPREAGMPREEAVALLQQLYAAAPWTGAEHEVELAIERQAVAVARGLWAEIQAMKASQEEREAQARDLETVQEMLAGDPSFTNQLAYQWMQNRANEREAARLKARAQ